MRGKVPSVNEREHFKFQKRFKKSSGLRRKIKLLDKIHLASSDTPNVRFGISPLELGGRRCFGRAGEAFAVVGDINLQTAGGCQDEHVADGTRWMVNCSKFFGNQAGGMEISLESAGTMASHSRRAAWRIRSSQAGRRQKARRKTSSGGKDFSRVVPGMVSGVAAGRSKRGEPSSEQGEPSSERGEPSSEQGERSSERGERSSERGKPSSERGEPTRSSLKRGALWGFEVAGVFNSDFLPPANSSASIDRA